MNLDSMPEACHIRAMASLQVKNIPDKLRQRLQRYAREHKCTLGEVVLTAVERELARKRMVQTSCPSPNNGAWSFGGLTPRTGATAA